MQKTAFLGLWNIKRRWMLMNKPNLVTSTLLLWINSVEVLMETAAKSTNILSNCAYEGIELFCVVF